MMLPEQTCRRFTLAEIKLATKNFHETLVIGKGGFGKVYKCRSKKIGLVTEIAIKRLDSKSSQGASEFEAEVEVLSKLRHGNLVPLIGYCNEGEEMILAYEFMPNGTLEDHLHKHDHTDLSWLQRLKICVGAARGLDYLHTGTATQHGVTHRDVKTSNILLDANFAAKIADFGLAKVGPINQTHTFVSTGVKGTFGYMDPCYFYSGKLTRKSDVYAFGVVLFEVLCGKKAVDPTLDKEQWSLAVWAQDQIKEGKLSQLIDSRLMGQISKKCLKEFVSIAGQCIHNQPKIRPTMSEVVVKLESIMSQDRKNAGSNAGEGGLIDKVRIFLTGKPNMMAAPAVGSQPKISASNIQKSFLSGKVNMMAAPAVGSQPEISASNIQKSFLTGKPIMMEAPAVGSQTEISASNIQKSLLTGKPNMMAAPAVGSQPVVSATNFQKSFLTGKPIMMEAPAVGSQPEISASDIQKSLLAGKPNMMAAPAVGSQPVISATYFQKSFLTGKPKMMAVQSQPEISASNIQISNPFPVKGIKIFNNRTPILFTYAELENATNNFQHKEYSRSLAGIIYKGWVDEKTYAPTENADGLAIYVRQAWKIDFKVEQFIHPNLVTPLGYCMPNNNHVYLVYELITDASLDKLLLREIGTSPLSWDARLKIAIGAAQGLSFLHRREQASYRQFKTAVILVDNDFNAQLSNYEVRDVGTFEESDFFTDRFYASPECLRVQRMTRRSAAHVISSKAGFKMKNEIYGFGVTMLEILTGMKVFDDNRPQGKQNLVEWAFPLLRHEANLGKIIDPHLGHPPKGAYEFALLVSNCFHPYPIQRPKMEEIVKVLYECYEIYTGSNS